MPALVPVTVLALTVIVCVPTFVNVALKLPVPLVKPDDAGSCVWALVSVLLKLTCPAKPVTVLLYASSAVTLNVNELPATVVAGVPVTAK